MIILVACWMRHLLTNELDSFKIPSIQENGGELGYMLGLLQNWRVQGNLAAGNGFFQVNNWGKVWQKQ